MNNVTKYLFFALILFNLSTLKGAIGCLDASKNLKESFDSKNYHLVSCDCPCIKLQEKRNICTKCLHAHWPKPMHILKNTMKNTQKKQEIDPFINPKIAIKQLIQRAKTTQ